MTNNNFTINEVYKHGLELVKHNWKTLLAIGAVFLALNIALNIITPMFVSDTDNYNGIAAIILLIINLIYIYAYNVLTYNTIKTLIGMSTTHSSSFKAIFNYNSSQYIKYLKFIAINIIYGFIVLIGTLLFIIPGIYFAIKYQFALYLFVDKNTTIKDSFATSALMTKGKIWQLLGLNIVFVLTILVGLIALFVGVIPAFMLVTMSAIYLYNKLSKDLVATDN